MVPVQLEKIGKVYSGGVKALRDVSLQLEAGERLTVLGPSGSGKTTLLRLISGLEKPTSGVVRVDGSAVNGVGSLRGKVGLVFQRPAIYPFLNVRNNLAFPLKMQKVSAAETIKRVEEIADWLAISHLLNRESVELSGGEQQRVALGRVLIRKPRLVLCDEPFSSLDRGLRENFRRELPLLMSRIQATMIYVTHDQEEALALGDRVLVLWHGQIMQIDRPTTLYHQPANSRVAGLVGSPIINLIDGTLIEENDSLLFQSGSGRLKVPSVLQSQWRPLAGRDLRLGIRPESITMQKESSALWHMKATVSLIEDVGPARLIAACHGPWRIVARLENTKELQQHSDVILSWEPEQTLLFDQVTGQALPAFVRAGSRS